jgi:hypothetical protein
VPTPARNWAISHDVARYVVVGGDLENILFVPAISSIELQNYGLGITSLT